MTPDPVRRLTAVAVAAATLTGCGPTAPAAAPAATGYDQVIAQVYGTPAQRRAADARAWWTARLAAADCMTRAGHSYAIAGYTAPSLRDDVAAGNLLAFTPTGPTLGVAEKLTRAADTRLILDAAARAATDYRPGTDRAATVRRCETEAAAEAANRVPDEQQALAAQLVDQLRQVQTTHAPTLPADYRTCMTAAGTPAADVTDLRARVERMFPPTAADAYDPTTVPGWADAVAAERRAAAADTRCRKDAVKTVRAAADRQMTGFAREHAAELKRVAAGWAWIQIDARNAETAAGPED